MKITIIFTLISVALKAVKSEKSCMYGWTLSDDETTCYVNCMTSQFINSNVYCQYKALKSTDARYNSTSNTLSMSAGETMGVRASRVPSCYNVTLHSGQYDVTEDGLIRIGPLLMQIAEKNVMQMSVDSVTLCYPSSPQLLQCNTTSAPFGTYHILNGTMLSVPQNNFTAYLGDFYVNHEQTAFFCDQSSINEFEFTAVPRCNMVVLQHHQYQINSDGSMTVTMANVTIENPLYSINYSQHALVCFPLNVEFLNCNNLETLAEYGYIAFPNLTILDEFLWNLVDPFNYYIIISSYAIVIANQDVLMNTDVILSLIYDSFNVLSSFALLLTVFLRFQMFVQNYQNRCLLCHIVCLAFYLICIDCQVFLPYGDVVSCYAYFAAQYFFYLSTYLWLNVIAYDSYRYFSRIKTVAELCPTCDSCWTCLPDNNLKRFVVYNVYCWGLSLILTIIILILDLSVSPYDFSFQFRPNILPGCYFNNYKALILFYYAPMGVTTILNLVFLGLAIHIINRASLGTEVVNDQRGKQVFQISSKLFILMGLSWIMNFLCTSASIYHPGTSVFQPWYLSNALTSLQGVIVSIIYCARKEVVNEMRCCQNMKCCNQR